MFVFACGLLLALVSAGTVRAASAIANPTTACADAPDGATATADAVTALHDVDGFYQPAHNSGGQEPTDSRDAVDERDDERDDDESGGDHGASRTACVGVEAILGLRHPSRASELSISSDGSTLAPQFLTDSVRRL